VAKRIDHLVIFLLGSERNTTKTISTVNENRSADASDEAYGLTVKRDGTNPKSRIIEIFNLSVCGFKEKV
jgi:hypothetical protein